MQCHYYKCSVIIKINKNTAQDTATRTRTHGTRSGPITPHTGMPGSAIAPHSPARATQGIFKRDLGPPYAWHLWVYHIPGQSARELLPRPPEAPATQNSTGPGMWALGGGAEGPPLRRPA